MTDLLGKLTGVSLNSKAHSKYNHGNGPSASNKLTFVLKQVMYRKNVFLKNAIDQRRGSVKFALFSQTKTTVLNKIKINGHVYVGLIDTETDVSLLSDRIRDRFSTKLVAQMCPINGITPGQIISGYQVDADVEITGQSAKLTETI